MKSISVFDIIKIGIGPSSSHTMGPWKLARLFTDLLEENGIFEAVVRVRVFLYGSLALTGIGHGSDVAILLGLSGVEYTRIDASTIPLRVEEIKRSRKLFLKGKHEIVFSYAKDIIFERGRSLPRHPNGMRFEAILESGDVLSEECYSVGGGFVIMDTAEPIPDDVIRPRYPCHDASSIEAFCSQLKCSVSSLVRCNEEAWRSEEKLTEKALGIWSQIVECVYEGLRHSGELPGGLRVKRRARDLSKSLLSGKCYETKEELLDCLRRVDRGFTNINKWVSCFALAVNEENASFGRVVTAPTNGAAGVVSAVLMYGYCFEDFSENQIVDFILVAGEIGTLFKKNATISAAMGGCQAEIGVSSAMAAAALVQCRNGTPGQVLMAAEIAMEHHLGLTCDPIRGLVQIPCIERNSMGAIKAITAANLALESDPSSAKVRLDDVIATMWSTAQDMSSKYKETSTGGLAANISVNNSEC